MGRGLDFQRTYFAMFDVEFPLLGEYPSIDENVRRQVVKKANVKATEEVEEEDSVLKAAKSKEQRSRLRAAFDSMWEMEWFAVQERRRLGGCVPPPPPPPRLAAPAVPAPAPAPAAVAAAVTAVTATRTGAADEGRGNGQEAAAGSKKKPAAGNNKKRKHANDGAAPMEEAPATAGSALSAAAAAPAAKQPAKRFKSRCSSQTARACWAALVASQRKRKLSARAATAATPRQQQQPEGAAPAAVRPAVAGDNGKKKALLRARIAELEAHHAANTQLLRRAWGDLQSFRAMLRGIVGEEGVERAAAAAAAVPSPPPAAAKAGTGEGDGEKGGGGEGWCDDRSAYFDEPTRCLLEQVVDHTRRQRVCRALYEAMETARGRPPHALAFGFYTLEQVERVLAAARRLVRGDCLYASVCVP